MHRSALEMLHLNLSQLGMHSGEGDCCQPQELVQTANFQSGKQADCTPAVVQLVWSACF